MRPVLILSAFAVFLSTSAALSALFVAQTNDTADIRDRLDKYLIDYEPRLSALVADEEMTQRMQQNRFVTYRRIESEVAFVALPDEAGWLGLRRVIKVNGKAVKDAGTSLARLLAASGGADFDQARVLLAESAAHNLGAPRTINLPNLPLEMLHPSNRWRFAHEIFGREKIRGTSTILLRMDETATPTMIQQPNGGDMKTILWAWVDPAAGRLLRAQVTTRDVRIGMPGFDAVVRVDFGVNTELGLLVPIEMQETFFVDRGRPGTGTAKYRNYRQFRTSARIIPQ